MKKLIIRIAVGLVVLVVIALAVVFFSLNSIVKKGVETVGPKLTKVEMRLGGVNLSPLSGNGRLSDLFVGNPEGYHTASAIKVGDINVGLQVGSVLSDTLVVEGVNIQAPEITLEGSLSGNNLSKILDNLNAAAGEEKRLKRKNRNPPSKRVKKSSSSKMCWSKAARSMSASLPWPARRQLCLCLSCICKTLAAAKTELRRRNCPSRS